MIKKHIKLNKKLLPMSLGGLVVAVGVGIPGVADATLHFVAGAKCVVEQGPAPLYDFRGSIGNGSGTTDMWVVCPGDTLDLATNVTSKLSVTDNTTTDQVCCSTRTRNAGGGAVVTGSQACTSISGTGTDQFLVPGDIGVSGTFNYHWVECFIPPASGGNRSSVNGYRISDI